MSEAESDTAAITGFVEPAKPWVADAFDYANRLVEEMRASPKRFYNEAHGCSRALAVREFARALALRIEPLIVHERGR